MNDKVLWSGRVNDYPCKIVELGPNDALVEVQDVNGNWSAVDDDAACSEVYMMAFFEMRRIAVKV